MKISYFREFIILSRYLNFSLAAKHLHMTQPGLSRHISSLETEVGSKLFERDTHRVKLTEKGKHFLSGIKKIIDDYDFLCEAVSKGGLEKITIGVPYFGVKKYLSPIMSLFEAANPKVKINYLPAYPHTIVTGLFSKQVDVAVLPKVDFPNSKDLIFHDAFNEPVVLLLNRNHPLASRTGVQIGDLKNENFLSLKGKYAGALFEYGYEFCRKHGFVPTKKELETETVEEAALSMKPDTGVLILPGHLKEANLSENVKCINVLDEDCYLTISLVHHPENQNPITEEFIRFYIKQVRHDKKMHFNPPAVK